MSLISFSFVIFLPLAVCVNFIIPRRYRYIWLFAASCFFYFSNGAKLAAGLIFCVVTTYLTALLLERLEDAKRKYVLGACVSINVLLLLLLQYSALSSLAMSLGMSFYTLQALGYVADVYKKRLKAERNLMRYALFVAFFPAILAGPIQRGAVLLPQIEEGRDFDDKKAHSGLYLLLWGYLLKIVMADQLAPMVDFAYDSYMEMPGAALLWATVLYAVQLYCDFAGYSALALGTGKLLGFDLGGNFEQPYFSTSIKEFWSRWHISLSSWLRDYVYIPLGGNRKGKLRRYGNLMVTFLVSGLWHGTGVNFLVWGGLHGFYQIVGSCFPKRDERAGVLRRGLRMTLTFGLVDFAWIFFRAESMEQAVGILQRILFCFNLKETTYYGSYLLGLSKRGLLLMIAGIVFVCSVDLLHEKKISIEYIAMHRINIVVRWLAYIGFTLFILFVAVRNYGQAASTFIYTRF